MTVNSGSTSVKLAAFAAPQDAQGTGTPQAIARERHDGVELPAPELLRAFLARLERAPVLVAHRVVHGGTRFTAPTRLDESTEATLAALVELAPLHNPAALRWLEAARSSCPAATHVAVFDTAFFAQLPRVAAEYALPAALGTALGVRRYGFHGLAHEAMWRRFAQLRPDLERGGRLITLQLGGGCSMAAIQRGRPLDTSMGFSPLEGLVMATRSGDLDPAAVPFLAQRLGLTGEQVLERLNHDSGLRGLSGGISSAGGLLDASSPQARFALELYCYRARKYLGAYLAVLGGCDGIVFGGGVGEHVPEVRAQILSGMAWAGIVLDARANAAARGAEARISTARSAVDVRAIPVDEELGLARAALPALAAPASAPPS